MKKLYSLLAVAAIAFTANAQIVINEVYGGGGNSGATLKYDFVELINSGTTTVTLTGAYLQYGGATSTTPIGASNIQALPDITLNPGQTYLIQEAMGAGGTADLPTPDYVPTVNILAMSGTGGKLFLTSNNTPVASATDANILDRVAWGTGAVWAETAPAPATTNTTSISRTNGVDTNNNSVDFTTGAPTPKNSLGAVLGVTDFNSSKSYFVKNTFVKDELNFGTKADVKVYNMNGQVVKSASVSEFKNLEVADLAPGMYIVTGNVNGTPVSQKIMKK